MLEGAIEPKAIAKHAKRLGFPAAALVDRNGLYAAMPFTDACLAEGVQPIIGTLLALARPADIGPAGAIDWLVLLAKDEAGYDNLCKLVSGAHLERPVHEDPPTPRRPSPRILSAISRACSKLGISAPVALPSSGG